jgi:ankyrin repeat protein
MRIVTKHPGDRLPLRPCLAAVMLLGGGLLIGWSSLDLASIEHEEEMMELRTAAVEGDAGQVQAILGRRSNRLTPADYEEALRLAVLYGHHDVMREFLAGGVDPNAADTSGRTVAMMAVICRETPALMQELIASGASVDTVDARGRTPLMEAVASGQRELVRVLLEAGANVGRADDRGDTPMTLALEAGDHGILDLVEKAQIRAKNRLRGRIAGGQVSPAQRRPA